MKKSCTYRLSPRTERLLVAIAATEDTNKTTTIERAVAEYAKVHGIRDPQSTNAAYMEPEARI